MAVDGIKETRAEITHILAVSISKNETWKKNQPMRDLRQIVLQNKLLSDILDISQKSNEKVYQEYAEALEEYREENMENEQVNLHVDEHLQKIESVRQRDHIQTLVRLEKQKLVKEMEHAKEYVKAQDRAYKQILLQSKSKEKAKTKAKAKAKKKTKKKVGLIEMVQLVQEVPQVPPQLLLTENQPIIIKVHLRQLKRRFSIHGREDCEDCQDCYNDSKVIDMKHEYNRKRSADSNEELLNQPELKKQRSRSL